VVSINGKSAGRLGFDWSTQLQHLLTDAGEANQANEIGQHIAKAQHLR
jgi:hypothetical protein